MKNIIYILAVIVIALSILEFVMAENADEIKRDIFDIVNSENVTGTFMKTYPNAVLTMNYDNITDRWFVTIISKDGKRLRLVIDNETKKVIHTKILTPKPTISKIELGKRVNNISEIKGFIINCQNNDCGQIKTKRWYNKEKGVWVVVVYGNCKNCKRTFLIDGQTGSVVEHKRVIDRTRLLNLIKFQKRIKNFMKNHPNARINTVYDGVSNQWHVTLSHPMGPGKVKEITMIVDRETGRVVSINEWEYSRDKFR